MPRLKINKLIIIAAVIIGCILFFASLLGNNASNKTGPTISPSSQPLPGITNVNNNPLTTTFSNTITTPQPDINKYTVEYPTEENMVATIESAFDVTNPQHIVLENFNKYSWTKGSIQLSYNPVSHTLSYLNTDILNNPKPLSEIDYAGVVNSITPLLNLPKHISLKRTRSVLLTSNDTVVAETTNPNKANMIQMDFQYLLNNQPIYTAPFEQNDVSILINTAGIRTIKAKVLPQINNNNKTVGVINFADAKQKISSQQGTILSVETNQYQETGPQFDITKFSANEAIAGYIIADNEIISMYVFIGKAPSATDPNTTYVISLGVAAEKK